MFEDAGMGLAGVKDGTTANTGNSEWDAILNGTNPDLSQRPGATQDENGNWTIPDMNVQ